MRATVIGGRGLLGTDLCIALAREFLVTCLDLPGCDITRPSSLAAALSDACPDVVVNCAAYTNVDKAEVEPLAAFAVNDDGAANVAVACRGTGAYLVHMSTDYVFDGRAQTPYATEAAPSPLSVYGRSKLAGERRVLDELPGALIVRSCGLYGRSGPSFVASILRRARGGHSLRIVDDQTVGAPTYSVDLANAIVQAILARPHGIRHIVNTGVCTWYEFGKEALRAAGMEGRPVEPVASHDFARPAPRPRYSALAPSEPTLRHFSEALADFVPAWLRELEDAECTDQ